MPDPKKVIAGLEAHANMETACATANKEECPYYGYHEKDKLCSEKLAEDALAMMKEQQWHPVTDPPKKSEVCLMTCNQWGGEIVRKGYYFSGEKIFEENGKDITEYVTHWRLAPKPPKEAENGT